MLTKSSCLIALSTGLLSAASFAACPAGTSTAPVQVDGKETCILSGTYTSDLTLRASQSYVLSGGVFIGGDNTDSATVTIQPGTKIVGQSGADFMVINRGSKIDAAGTESRPIVFTSAKAEGQRNRGDWGGLIINGNAPINGCNAGTALCEAEGEGNTGLYGGNNPSDNSGVLKYVRVEFAGNEITPDNELNGIAFQGVGAGTLVDYIQVHMNADDGVEFFGGTVNAKHVVLTGNRDDSLDWVNGWVGKMQFVAVEQYDDQANNGIEGDNLKASQDASPRSNPSLANMTFIGTTSSAAKGGSGLLLRRGTGAEITNSVFTGFKVSCIDLDDAATFGTGLVNITNTFFSCQENFTVDSDDGFSLESWFTAESSNKVVSDVALNGFVPATRSPLLGAGATPFDLFFDDVDYVGAVSGAGNDWTAGWTTSARN